MTELRATALVFGVLVLVTAGVELMGQSAPSPVGHWTCHGTQTAQPYDITLDVKEFGHTYELQWTSPDSEVPALIGLGLLQDSILSVAIVSPRGGVGVAQYRVGAGRLEGVWTRGDGGIDVENCQQGRPA